VRKAKTILENTRKVIAIELLTACQAIDFREQKKLSPITQKIYEKIRERVPFIEQDEIMYPYIELVDMLIKDEVFDPWLEI
jgi:histidine ammonia-lyase